MSLELPHGKLYEDIEVFISYGFLDIVSKWPKLGRQRVSEGCHGRGRDGVDS